MNPDSSAPSAAPSAAPAAAAPAGVPAPSPISTLCAERRAALPPEARDALPGAPWGLALSGGGIRSATFCFGLIKALARQRLLHRFDLMSTVSGGGYIGATVGKLYQNAHAAGQGPLAVEAALADAESRWFALWLRANGRYLIPRGTQDLVFALANFSRNLVGIHLELAFVCLLLGSVLVGLDLLVWGWADGLYRSSGAGAQGPVGTALLALLSPWPTPWLLLPLPGWAGAVAACAYWVMPARAGQSLGWPRWLGAALGLAGTLVVARLWSPGAPGPAGMLALPPLLLPLVAGLLAAWVAGTALAWWLVQRHPNDPDRARNRLTTLLARMLRVGLVLAGLGLVDLLAWRLAEPRHDRQWLAGGALVLLAAALRAVLPKISDLPRSLTPTLRRGLTSMVNLAGLALVALLLVFWVSLLHRAATLSLFPADKQLTVQFALAWRWLLLAALPVALVVLLSWRNHDFLNRSSLYAFYRARLVRSYLGAANPARFGPGTHSATDPMPGPTGNGGARVRVEEVAADDDVPMARYQPHAGGGPVHLINVCLNQTRDPRGSLFNQDRKGLPLTIGPRGQVSVGDEPWHAVQPDGALSLGAWTAISGAAVAPGLGSSTRPGVAALLTLAGVRLGYWWDSAALQRPGTAPALPQVGKYGQLLSELRGRFDGDARRHWYLSDGGHFENTGAYPLLRAECALVLVADCGADPRYAFGDLENLVRKARIDLQAEITFLKPRPGPAQACGFGSLNDLASADSQACLALARVHYGRSGRQGHLVIVKPNMCAGTPVDLVNFKADNPLFPQEPTTDQFFSEAQWESYFKLGQTLGERLDLAMLGDLPAFDSTHFMPDDGAITITVAGEPQIATPPKRLPSRIAATGAVTASISMGAVATLATTAWQAVESERQARSQAATIDPASFKELADIFGRPEPNTPSTTAPAALAGAGPAHALSGRVGEMATALLRIGEAACNQRNSFAFRQSNLMQLMVASTKKACAEAAARHPACDALLNDDGPRCLQSTPRPACEPAYWVRQYADVAERKENCPQPVADTAAPAASPPGPPPASSPTPAPAPALLGGPASAAIKPTPAASAPAGAASAEPHPSSSPSPSPSPSPAAASASVPDTACQGKTIYLQIYGPDMRSSLRGLRDELRALGASVPPIEDVWSSARREGRNAPRPVSRPTLIVHDAASQACAELIKRPNWVVQPLAAQLRGSPGVLELWVPLLADASRLPPDPAWCYQEDRQQAGPQRYGVHCHASEPACREARGNHLQRRQSACTATSVSGHETLPFQRGWAGSWYLLGPQPFGTPFPAAPAAPPPPPATPAAPS